MRAVFSETDFTPRYYDKTFHLSKLQSVALFLSYWSPTLIAHTIMSFGFEGGEYIAISIETRKEKNEEYSTIAVQTTVFHLRQMTIRSSHEKFVWDCQE